MNEMDWRHYDPAIGRFNCIDKLAESFFDVTPYNFANNNPIYFNDPTGLGPVQTNYGVDAFGRQMYNENGMYIVPGARGGEVPFNMFNYMDGGNGYGGIRKAMANFFNNPTTGAMFARVYNEPYVINDGSGEVLDTVVLGFWETVEFGNSSDALEVGGATSDILRNMIYSTDGWLGKNGKFNSIDWGGNQHTGSRSGSLKASNGFKWLGRGAVYASFAIKGIELNQAYLKDGKKFGYNTERKLYTAAGSIAAGIIGAEIGAKVGVGIGVWFGGVGAVPAGVIGTIAGGVIGSVSGYFAGEAGDHYVGQVYDYYYFK